MLNNKQINGNNINYNSGINNTDENEILSSFSSFQITKYAIKTPLGQYFNLGSFGNYNSGICGEGKKIKYGNILIDTNVEDLSKKEIETGNNPILHGGIIQNTRFSEKEIEFTIKLFSKDRKNFEKEIRDIKRNFNLKGCKLLKKEFDRISEINIELEDLEIGNYNSKGTEITFNFISLDPNFKNPSGSTKAYRNISGNLNSSLIISNTDIEPFLDILIDIKEITGTITKIQLELDGYEIEISCNIDNPEKIVFDGKKSRIFVGNTEIEDFKGKFMPFPINKPKPVQLNFIGGNIAKYSIYFTYDNIYL